MTTVKLKHVHQFRDRHGKVRRYFRRPGHVTVPLPGEPGSAVFLAAYQKAMAGETAPKRLSIAMPNKGTISALVMAYFASADFKGLALSTQATYRNILERFREKYGALPVARLERKHIMAMMAGKSDTPGAGNSWLKRVRRLMRFAIDLGWITVDPTGGVRRYKMRGSGYHTWSEDEIGIFEKKHAPGTPARLAMALLLYTGQRRSDVVRMGRQHVRAGFLSIRQQKTGTVVEIPIHRELQAVLDMVPNDEVMTFLRTSYGNAFTPAGFGNWFHDRCKEAKLPEACSSHGLRKAAARRLAEAGCTEHEIMAITGHESVREVSVYTRAANRKRLATSAMEKVETGTKLANLDPRKRVSLPKKGKNR
jgi:integrase